MTRSVGSSPTHIAFTRQLSRYASSKTVSPPTVGTPTRVPVRRDPAHRARELVAGLGEAEPVEERDRPRAHRDDVAEDPADAGRGALERLDGGRVVVALDLERDRDPVAEVEHARVLARALEHALARRSAAASGGARSACSRSAPTREARRPRARSRSDLSRAGRWMRSCSPSVRPRARWSGCCATLLRGSAYRRRSDRAGTRRRHSSAPSPQPPPGALPCP